MEEFKKKLDALLAEYPDLPEFTIRVQPRVILTSLVPEVSRQAPPVQSTSQTVNTRPSDIGSSDVITSLESSVTSSRIAALQKANIE